MSHLNKKTIGAGAALVALSAVVPNLSLTDKAPGFGANFIGVAFAQATSKTTLNIKAKVSNPLKITEGKSMNFKTFATGGSGKYQIDPAGAKGATSKVVIIAAGSQGSVLFEAPQNATFSLSIQEFAAPGNVIMKTAVGGAASKSMTVKTITFKANATKMQAKTAVFKSAAGKFGGFKITDAAGTGKASIGATVYFTGNQVEGDYAGTYVVVQSLI